MSGSNLTKVRRSGNDRGLQTWMPWSGDRTLRRTLGGNSTPWAAPRVNEAKPAAARVPTAGAGLMPAGRSGDCRVRQVRQPRHRHHVGPVFPIRPRRRRANAG
jgi:hypothetical protein